MKTKIMTKMAFNKRKFVLLASGIPELKNRFKNRVTDYDVIKPSKVKNWDVIAKFFLLGSLRMKK